MKFIYNNTKYEKNRYDEVWVIGGSQIYNSFIKENNKNNNENNNDENNEENNILMEKLNKWYNKHDFSNMNASFSIAINNYVKNKKCYKII